jgi:hypothetical protein
MSCVSAAAAGRGRAACRAAAAGRRGQDGGQSRAPPGVLARSRPVSALPPSSRRLSLSLLLRRDALVKKKESAARCTRGSLSRCCRWTASTRSTRARRRRTALRALVQSGGVGGVDQPFIESMLAKERAAKLLLEQECGGDDLGGIAPPSAPLQPPRLTSISSLFEAATRENARVSCSCRGQLSTNCDCELLLRGELGAPTRRERRVVADQRYHVQASHNDTQCTGTRPQVSVPSPRWSVRPSHDVSQPASSRSRHHAAIPMARRGHHAANPMLPRRRQRHSAHRPRLFPARSRRNRRSRCS